MLGGLNETWKGLDKSWLFYVPREEGTRLHKSRACHFCISSVSRPGLSWREVLVDLPRTISLLSDSNPQPSRAPGAVSSFSPLPRVSGLGSGRSRALLVSALLSSENSGRNCLWVSRGSSWLGGSVSRGPLWAGLQGNGCLWTCTTYHNPVGKAEMASPWQCWKKTSSATALRLVGPLL